MTVSSSTPGFPPDVVDAVCAHMNNDHPDDNVLIVRVFGGVPGATGARMSALDGTGADFEVTSPGAADAVVRVPWAHPITERREVRSEVVRLYREACAALGVQARGEGAEGDEAH